VRRLAPLLVALASLVAGALPVAAEDAVTSETIAPGLVHHSLRRGVVADGTRYRVVVGRSESQREADELVGRVLELGREPAVAYRDHAYEVSVAGLASEAEAEAAFRGLLAGGFDELEVVGSGQDILNAEGPWRIEILEVDPSKIEIRAAHGLDAAYGVETTRALAHRHEAIAAVNGGFYVVGGRLAGDSTGILRVDGRIWSEPDRGRGAFAVCGGEARDAARVGRPALAMRLVFRSGLELPIDGVNRERGAQETILYTPVFHRTTLTGPEGRELVFANGALAEDRPGDGSRPIPPDGFVLSLGPESPRIGFAAPAAGEDAVVEFVLSSSLEPKQSWADCGEVLSAGPVILHDGRPVTDWSSESIRQVFSRARHPRTAAGVRADGTILLITVDGRDPETSVGMSIPELADLFLERGAVAAVNLDGGGSTTMVIRDEVVNHPSDRDGDRANGDALLLFPRAGAPR